MKIHIQVQSDGSVHIKNDKTNEHFSSLPKGTHLHISKHWKWDAAEQASWEAEQARWEAEQASSEAEQAKWEDDTLVPQSEVITVLQWLESLGLHKYFAAFIDEGYNTLTLIKNIQPKELDENWLKDDKGILARPKHKKKLECAIKELKEKDSKHYRDAKWEYEIRATNLLDIDSQVRNSANNLSAFTRETFIQPRFVTFRLIYTL